MSAAVERKFDAVMYQPFTHHSSAYTGFIQQIDCVPFEQSRSDTRLNMLTRLALEDDGFDPMQTQQLGQQKSRRACTNDGDLGSRHGSP